MPDTRSHRGAHPEDRLLFGSEALPALGEAAAHYCWLLTRGYARRAALKLVGDRFRLAKRQRVAVGRYACSDGELSERSRRCVPEGEAAGRTLLVDGYNVLTTVESALGGGMVLVGRDGAFRDMASMHGTFRKVAETVPALEQIGRLVASLGAGRCRWYFDRPVSNSGRLKTLVGRLAAEHDWPWEAELVFNPDQVLAEAGEIVATSDSAVLDRCRRWLNLARLVVQRHAPDAWIVDFGRSGD